MLYDFWQEQRKSSVFATVLSYNVQYVYTALKTYSQHNNLLVCINN